MKRVNPTLDETQLLTLVRDPQADSPDELAREARVREQWQQVLGQPRTADTRPLVSGRRFPWARPAMLLAMGAGALVVALVVSAPSRALASVAGAMKAVEVLHATIDLPTLSARYEVWADRRRGAKIESWEENRRTLVLVDDLKTLTRHIPGERQAVRGRSRGAELARLTDRFDPPTLIRLLREGRFLEGTDFLGKPTARRVSPTPGGGSRLWVDLKEGLFERLFLSSRPDGRIDEARLYFDERDRESDPFLVAKFDYPARLDAETLRFKVPSGVKVRWTQETVSLP